MNAIQKYLEEHVENRNLCVYTIINSNGKIDQSDIINNDNANQSDIINNNDANQSDIISNNDANRSDIINNDNVNRSGYMVSNDNANRSDTINNDNANRSDIINNDNANQSYIINNDNANRSYIINNDNANRSYMVSNDNVNINEFINNDGTNNKNNDKYEKRMYLLFEDNIIVAAVVTSHNSSVSYFSYVDSTGIGRGLTHHFISAIISSLSGLIVAFSYPDKEPIFGNSSLNPNKRLLSPTELFKYWYNIFSGRCSHTEDSQGLCWVKTWSNFTSKRSFPYKKVSDIPYFEDDPKSRFLEKSSGRVRQSLSVQEFSEGLLLRYDFVKGGLVFSYCACNKVIYNNKCSDSNISNNQINLKIDLKSDLKMDLKSDLKLDLKSNFQVDLNFDLKSDIKLYNKVDNNSDIKLDNKANNSDIKLDNKIDHKSDIKLDNSDFENNNNISNHKNNTSNIFKNVKEYDSLFSFNNSLTVMNDINKVKDYNNDTINNSLTVMNDINKVKDYNDDTINNSLTVMNDINKVKDYNDDTIKNNYNNKESNIEELLNYLRESDFSNKIKCRESTKRFCEKFSIKLKYFVTAKIIKSNSNKKPPNDNVKKGFVSRIF